MASEPVLSREVGNRTSRVTQPVMVTSAMLLLLCCFDVFRIACKDSEMIEDDQSIEAWREEKDFRKEVELQTVLSTREKAAIIYAVRH